MNPRSRHIVLDKSYLQGSPKLKICELCIDHNIVMTWPLFYEIMTARPNVRAQCFAKFPEKVNPIMICQNIGYLMGLEVERKEPLPSIAQALLKDTFQFNPNLIDPSYKLHTSQQTALDERNVGTSQDFDRFIDRLPTVVIWFPELNDIRVGSPRGEIQPLVDSVCKSVDKVRAIYRTIRSDHFPPDDALDEHWFLFKWVQTQVLAGIEYVRKYGISTSNISREKAEHIYWDLEICAVASMAGTIATFDKDLAWYFRQVCPRGTIIQN